MTRRAPIALGFLALIAVGAILLSSPWARMAGTWGGWSDALFTACSAVCVTGLSTVDVGSAFTRAGQAVVLALVEVGCLGLMTCSTFLLVAVGRRLSLSREFSLMNAYGVAGVHGLKGLILWTVGSMLALEGVGAALLYVRFRAWYPSVFYAVMSFCNAGFGLSPDSLAGFAGDPFVLFVLAAETILGGIGFLVLYNLCTYRFRRGRSGGRGRLSLHSAVVLRFTLYLLAIAFLAFLVLEWNGALKGYAPAQRLWVAFYQAVTPRTCGFTVIPIHELSPVTRFITAVLMFIGAAPGGTGGGIKVTTCAVFVLSILAICRGRDAVTLFRRTVPEPVAREAIVIVTVLALLVVLGMTVLLVSENRGGGEPVPFEALLFETISAVSTAGLSCGTTTEALSPVGRAVIMVCMFCGRLGALAVVFLIGGRETAPSRIRFPKEDLVVG